MGLDYKNLDHVTRAHMVAEIDSDVLNGNVYISSYLNPQGVASWTELLRTAASTHNDDWIADRLRTGNLLKTHAERKKPKGGYTLAAVPITAPETLGEGEFNRYYTRGLCARAVADGIESVIVYRAKSVLQPRPGSEEKIGHLFKASDILDDLRSCVGVEPLLGLPPGPNSGLCIRLQ